MPLLVRLAVFLAFLPAVIQRGNSGRPSARPNFYGIISLQVLPVVDCLLPIEKSEVGGEGVTHFTSAASSTILGSPESSLF